MEIEKEVGIKNVAKILIPISGNIVCQQQKQRIQKDRWLKIWEDVRLHFRHMDFTMTARHPNNI